MISRMDVNRKIQQFLISFKKEFKKFPYYRDIVNDLDNSGPVDTILRSIDQTGCSKDAFLQLYFQDRNILKKDIFSISDIERVKDLVNYLKNINNPDNLNINKYVFNGLISGREFNEFNDKSGYVFVRNFLKNFEKFRYNAQNGEIYFKTRPQFDGATGADILCKPIEETPKYSCVGGVANLYEYFPNLFS